MVMTWLDRRILRLFKDNPGFTYTVLCIRSELNLTEKEVPALKERVFAMRDAGILKKDGKMYYALGDTSKITPGKFVHTSGEPPGPRPLFQDALTAGSYPKAITDLQLSDLPGTPPYRYFITDMDGTRHELPPGSVRGFPY